jgi:hypothetical protein
LGADGEVTGKTTANVLDLVKSLSGGLRAASGAGQIATKAVE